LEGFVGIGGTVPTPVAIEGDREGFEDRGY
jgi:hypothetical protein